MFVEILKKIWTFLFDTLQTVLLAASIFLIIYAFVMRPFQVNGLSMHPTFKHGEYVLTNLITLRFGNPVRGDVIVFKAPTDKDKDFIKRVIGLAGDRVMVKDNKVYLNGNLFDESAYLDPSVKTPAGPFLNEGEEVTVPQGEYFVMGDNRPASSDSRDWGFLKQNEIIGKSFFVYWPPQNMRLVKNPFSEKK